MKNIEFFWNIVFFGIYRFDVYLRGLIGYLNPFKLIHKIRSVRKYHYSHGVDDMNKFRNQVFNNPRDGISSIRSGAIIGGLLVFIAYGLFNIIQKITGRSLIEKVWEHGAHFFIYLTVILIPVFFINNYLLFREDKYISYFNEFEKMDKNKKRAYYFLSFISVVLIVSFFFLSFLLL